MKPALVKRSFSGMTLFELIVVIAVLSSLFGIGLPYFLHTFLPRYHLKSAGETLIGEMLYARSLAVKTNRQHRIIFDEEANAYWIEVGDRSSESANWSPKSPVNRFSEPGGGRFPGVALTEATSNALVFKPSGGQTAMSISLQHYRGATIRIITAMSGRIRMERLG